MKHLKNIAAKYKSFMLLYLVMGLAQAFLQNFGSRYFQIVIDRFTNQTLTIANITLS